MRRRWMDRFFSVLVMVCAGTSVGIMGLIMGAIIYRGGSAISWSFLTGPIRLAGAGGGILYNIIGTLILLAAALLVSVPPATGVALVHGFYLRTPRVRERLWLLLSVLNGVPSILFGLFGFLFFVQFLGWGKSWLSGGVLLGIMIFPTLACALSARIQSLPRKYLEAAAALGLSQGQVVWSVVLPQCAGGLVTGALLGLARAAGETAPILFTATIFAGATIPSGIRESPVLSLPYHIFVLAQDSFDPAAGNNLWGAALVLLTMTMVLSLLALRVRIKLKGEACHE